MEPEEAQEEAQEEEAPEGTLGEKQEEPLREGVMLEEGATEATAVVTGEIITLIMIILVATLIQTIIGLNRIGPQRAQG